MSGLDLLANGRGLYSQRLGDDGLGVARYNNEQNSSVYFILADDVGVCKIGKSTEPRHRMASIQSHSPVKLTLLGRIWGGIQVERWFHNRLFEHRSHMEWFHYTSEVDRVVSHALALGLNAAEKMCPHSFAIDKGRIRPGEASFTFLPMPRDGSSVYDPGVNVRALERNGPCLCAECAKGRCAA